MNTMDDLFLAACYWKPSIDLRGEVRKARGLAELVDLLRVDECDSVVNASAIALRNLAIDQKNCDVLGGWAIKELIAVLPDASEQRPSLDVVIPMKRLHLHWRH